MDMENKSITWFQINNIVPLIFSLVAMVLAFGTLKADIALLNQKQDTIISQQNEMLRNIKEIVLEQSTLALKQKELETKWNMYREQEFFK